MAEYIHWWQFPLNLISLKLNQRFKDNFFKKVKRDFSSVNELALFLQEKSRLYNKNITTDYRIVWQYHKKAKYIPAWVIYEIAKKIKTDLSEIEENIESYISTYGKLYIYNPILPIKITPEFTSIPIHIMCDGSIHKHNFIYFQKEKIGLERFRKLIYNVFGEYKIKKYKRSYYFPAAFSMIISNYFNISTYLSDRCRIPSKILKGAKENKIATLLAFLNDEGNVSGRVRFISSNKKFILDLKNIANSLGYSCKVSILNRKGKMSRDGYILYINQKSLEKFYQDYKDLISMFPCLDIGKKLEEIENIIKFNNRTWKQRKKFETKKIILDALRTEPKTAIELREIVGINLWTVYHHLQMLTKLGKIKKYKKGTRYKYQLIYQ